jgi:DNA replication and repair protein RecF
MALRQLKARDFRCFTSLAFEPGPDFNFIVGANAQGKTSLLEAICVLLRLTSPRSLTLAPLIRHEQSAFSLRGIFGDTQLDVRSGPDGRELALNETPQASSGDYLATAGAVWFGNTDLEIVSGSGEGRRRYLDFLGAQMEPLYRKHLRAYERALRSRNRLLKLSPIPRRELAAWDAPFFESGGLLQMLRANLVRELAPRALLSHAAIRLPAGEGSEQLGLEYLPSGGLDLVSALIDSAEHEARLGQTVVGPHRDDLRILLNRRSAAEFGSEGQQRTIVLALRLAQAELIAASRSAPPVLLIDDIFGELDLPRRNAVVAALPGGAQKFVTATSLAWLDAAPAGATWRIEGGVVHAA